MQVIPASEVSRHVLGGLRREFPQVLLVKHPIFRAWQLYEVPEGSDWDAQRLWNAIMSLKRDDSESSRIVEAWWLLSGTPRIFEDKLPMPPGEWLLQYLRENQLWRYHKGAEGFIKSYDDRIESRQQGRKRDLHDMNRAVADDIRKSAQAAIPAGMSTTDALKALRRRDGGAEIVY